MTELQMIEKQIDDLFRDGKLNTKEHLVLESERAKLWRFREANEDNTRLCLKEDSRGNWEPLFSKGFM